MPENLSSLTLMLISLFWIAIIFIPIILIRKKALKKDFIKGLKAEFNKIIWPDKDSLRKQSVVVMIVTVLMGITIAVLDLIIKYGLNIIIG